MADAIRGPGDVSGSRLLRLLQRADVQRAQHGDRLYLVRQVAYFSAALEGCRCGRMCGGCKALAATLRELAALTLEAEQRDADGCGEALAVARGAWEARAAHEREIGREISARAQALRRGRAS